MAVRRLGIEGASFDGDVFSGSVSGVPVPLTGLYGSPATPDLRLSTPEQPASGAQPLAARSTRSHSSLDLVLPPMSGSCP
jgi:hypothetical protein